MNTNYLTILLTFLMLNYSIAEDGISDNSIRIGSVLALKGSASGLGSGMKEGMEAALLGETIQGKNIKLIFRNDFYEPEKATKMTEDILKQDVFLVMGNVGTPTAKVTLPILARNEVPAFGFFTGAGLLRPGIGTIVNYRASYVQEVEEIVKRGIANGIKTQNICAYVQNDAYGMAGLKGLIRAFEKNNANRNNIVLLEKIIKMKGINPKRNNIGPVGVYVRNTRAVRNGYSSIINWESKTGNKCRLVITVGAYGNIAHFARLRNKDGRNMIISAVSFTGAKNLSTDLEKYSAQNNIIMTQVVPLLSSNYPIVIEARSKLGDKFGYVALEGYIIGRLFLNIMSQIEGDITRIKFINIVKKTKFDLGGVKIDFTLDKNQGSRLVVPTFLKNGKFEKLDKSAWDKMLR